mgnify:CR=1 FL=1
MFGIQNKSFVSEACRGSSWRIGLATISKCQVAELLQFLLSKDICNFFSQKNKEICLPIMEATNQETSEVTNSTKYELKNGENEGERVNPTIPMGTDVSESSSNAIVTAAVAVSTTPLAKEGYANGASSRVRAPPPFLLKVYDIVKNPETDSIISWSSSGTSFVVWDPHRFAAEVLGKYFRHNNFASFICQLNTYVSILQYHTTCIVSCFLIFM